MSPDDWQLLYAGRIVSVRRLGDDLELEVDLSRLGRSTTVRLRSVECFTWRPSHHTWEDSDIEEPTAIATAGLVVDAARWSRDQQRLVVRLDDGTILASYARFEASADLVDTWSAYWASWSESFEEDVHPLVRECLLAEETPSASALLDAWRDDRKSDLVAALGALEEPQVPVRLDSLAAFDVWAERFAESPVGSMRELARCAGSTFDIWIEDRDGAAQWWKRIAAVIGVVAPRPDPRIGHASLHALYSPSDWWFRIDQVAHIAGPFRAETDEPSFADHLFRLLEANADADTPRRALAVRDAILVECDCNGAEMGERLHLFAEETRARHPRDRPLSREGREALRWRLKGRTAPE